MRTLQISNFLISQSEQWCGDEEASSLQYSKVQHRVMKADRRLEDGNRLWSNPCNGDNAIM